MTGNSMKNYQTTDHSMFSMELVCYIVLLSNTKLEYVLIEHILLLDIDKFGYKSYSLRLKT